MGNGRVAAAGTPNQVLRPELNQQVFGVPPATGMRDRLSIRGRGPHRHEAPGHAVNTFP